MAGILQKLIAATGKSADEIMEIIGKKAASGADEIDMGDITSPSIKKGRPAKSPMIDPNEIDLGKPSRKNIETGDIQSSEVPLNDLDLGDAPNISPSIDDYRLPTANPNTARGLQGGGLPPSVINEADDMAGPLARRGSTMPDEMGPQVIGKGTSRAGKQSNEAIEAELVKKGMNPRLAKIAIASGLIGGGAMMLSGGDDEQPPIQPPMAPDSPKSEKILPDNYMDLALAEANNQGLVSPSMSAGPAKPAGAPMAPPVPVEPTEDTGMSALSDAQASDTQNRLTASLLRAGIQGGAAIAGTQADYNVVDALDKNVGAETKKVKEKQTFDKDQQELAKAKAEINDDKAMRDPNSDISKMTVGLATQLGIIKPGQRSSAMDLKNSGINLGTLMATIEAAKGRKEAASLARETRASDTQSKLSSKKEEEALKREDKRRMTTEEIESRKRTIEDNIKRARDLVEKFGTVEATGPQAEMLQGMLDEIAVDTAKIQDPDSVARPAEVQLVRRSLIPEELSGRMGMTNKTAVDILDAFEKRIQERAATGYKVRGIQPPTDRVSPKDEDNNLGQSDMVKVLPPGGTKPKLIPKSQLKSALDAGGKLVE